MRSTKGHGPSGVWPLVVLHRPLVREIPDEAVAEHIRRGEVPTTRSTMHLYPVDGAAHRVASDEIAWGHRDAQWSMVIAGVDPDNFFHVSQNIEPGS